MILYLAVTLLVCSGFISILHKMEIQLVETLRLSSGASTGVVMKALWKNHQFQRMTAHLVSDAEVARQLLSVPPADLFYGWTVLSFTPLLAILGASGRIAEELADNSVRFIMLRTTRLAWVLGKFAGQALLLSACGAWIIIRFRLTGFAAGAQQQRPCLCLQVRPGFIRWRSLE